MPIDIPAVVIDRLPVYARALTGLEVQGRDVVSSQELGALLGVGFAAMITLTATMFSNRPLAGYWIDAGYQVAYLILIGLVLVAWR